MNWSMNSRQMMKTRKFTLTKGTSIVSNTMKVWMNWNWGWGRRWWLSMMFYNMMSRGMVSKMITKNSTMMYRLFRYSISRFWMMNQWFRYSISRLWMMYYYWFRNSISRLWNSWNWLWNVVEGK